MTIEIIHQQFVAVINTRGIYHKLGLKKNTVAQYRWKVKRGVHITIDKKLKVIQRAGIRLDAYEFTQEDVVKAIQFAIRTNGNARELGPAYLFEKWRRSSLVLSQAI